jgi:Lon protease-like protein
MEWTARAAEGLPIFPLPRVVLMPGEQLPLHVFEPRYRRLVDHCRAEGVPMGIATLRPGMDAAGRPKIHPELGIGQITRHRPLPDGRCDIVVGYVATGCVVREVESADPFRRVAVSLFPPLASGTYPPLAGLRSMALQVAARVGPALDTSAWAELRREAWLHAAARAFLADADARRAYLVAASGADRAALVSVALAGLIEHVVPALED